jgi:hypothetical protein
MDKEVVRVVLRGVWEAVLRVRAAMMPFVIMRMAIGEDDYFVDAEDGEGAGDMAGERGAKFGGLSAV